MATYLSQEKKKDLFREYGGSETNTGSTEAQVALLTYRITSLSAHLRENRKDHSCRRTLLTLVGRRKRLLNYLAKKDISKYRSLTDQLGLRK
jgi:small subunit ribosomal protein S15